MNEKTNLQLEFIRIFSDIFSKNKIEYWVMGGFAIDGICNEITRSHDDIDFIIEFKDRDKVASLVTSKEVYDFLIITEWKDYKFVAYEPKNHVKIDFVFIHNELENFVFKTKDLEFDFPKTIFSKTPVNIHKIAFNIVDPTFIYATKILNLRKNTTLDRRDKIDSTMIEQAVDFNLLKDIQNNVTNLLNSL